MARCQPIPMPKSSRWWTSESLGKYNKPDLKKAAEYLKASSYDGKPWGANVAETKWPSWRCAHDAREDHGAPFYTIDPQSTITALRSDTHIPIKPGTDAALALSIMQVIFENGWEDSEFLLSKTCAPYLVKEDWTCLRESDLGVDVKDGADDRVYVWDKSKSGFPWRAAWNPSTLP